MNKASFDIFMQAHKDVEESTQNTLISLVDRYKARHEELFVKTRNITVDFIPYKYFTQVFDKMNERFENESIRIYKEHGVLYIGSCATYAKLCVRNNAFEPMCLIKAQYSAYELETSITGLKKYEELYEAFVDALPDIYQFIADRLNDNMEKKKQHLLNSAEGMNVAVTEKKITRVTIEIVEEA